MIRSLWAALNLLIATFLLASITLVGALLGKADRVGTWAARTWARWTLAASGTTVRLEGVHNLPPGRPQIIVANHVSWYDVFALAAWLPKRYRFAAKKELARIPIFGQAWQSAGHISIDRGDRNAAVAALAAAGAAIRSDNSAIIIFPEGTRSATGELLPFKKGAFMLARQLGVEIVPVAIVGSRAIQPKNDWRVNKGEITVRFAPPIDPSEYGETGREELIQRVRGEIEAMLAAPPDQVN